MAGYPAEQSAKPKLSADEAAKIVQEVRENAELHWNHERTNIDEATIDQRFRANDQWPEAAKRQREAEGRPMLTFNQMNQFINQVVNPIRQADIAIKTSPVDGKSDPELSKVYNGLLRQIQYHSSARAVYAHALDCQAGCGIGAFRICHDYRDHESFDQEIYIERINNPLAVGWDPAARDPVRSDAMWMFIAESGPVSTVKAKWPDKATEDVETMQAYGDTTFWYSTEAVRVAEYYRKVPVKKTLAKLQDGQVIDITDKKGEAELGQLGIVATRKVNSYKIEKYFVSGRDVLEGPHEVPGCYIPIILVIGGEVAMEKGAYRFGVTRFARDAQQMYNMTRTAQAESIGNSPKAPYMVTDKMVSKHKGDWDTLNKSNRPYQRYTPDKDAPQGPKRENPIVVQPALTEEALMLKDDMQTGVGVTLAQQGKRSNETSGVAIDARKLQGEIANYGFLDNFTTSLEHAGRVLVDWIPKIYDNERVMRIIGEDGKEEQTVPINFVIYGQDQQPVMINDLNAAKFDVRVSVGPGYSTRRAEAAAAISEFMKAMPPEMAAVMADLVATNSDWAGHEEIAKRLKALLQKTMPGIVEAAEAKEGETPPQQQEGPPPELQMQMVLTQLKDAMAKVEKTMAETQKTQAQTLQIQAQTDKTTAETASVVQGVHHADARLPHELAGANADNDGKRMQQHRDDARFPHEMEHQRAQTQNLLSPPEPRGPAQ